MGTISSDCASTITDWNSSILPRLFSTHYRSISIASSDDEIRVGSRKLGVIVSTPTALRLNDRGGCPNMRSSDQADSCRLEPKEVEDVLKASFGLFIHTGCSTQPWMGYCICR